MNEMTKVARLNLTAWLGRRSRFFLSSLALFGLVSVSFLRCFTPAELQVTFLFLLPISFATWFLSTLVGSLFAAAATIVLLGFDLGRLETAHHNILVSNTVMNLVFFAAVVFIFSEVRTLYDREQELSLHDPLTGLLNHRAFVEKVATENRRLQRHPNSLTLVYIDLDDFKRVNDDHGHAVGNALLLSIGRMMTTTVRSTDSVARLGGDEFAMLLPDTDSEAAKSVLTKVQEKLLQHLKEKSYPVTCSMGAVTFTQMHNNPSEMIYLADETMYKVKQRGKNGIEYRVCE
ncbi:MAG TPA: GGDEF domain-containing protein [Nitrososphaera sp.]|nr:GGDEF domain-containing protein [Nitrososphaera sp.]